MTGASVTKQAGGIAPASPAPDPEAIRGTCPCCSAAVVSSCFHVAGRGFVIIWECVSCPWSRPL